MYIYLYQRVYKFNKNGLTYEIVEDIRNNRKTLYKTYISKLVNNIVRIKLGLLVNNKEGGISLINKKTIKKYKDKKDLFDNI